MQKVLLTSANNQLTMSLATGTRFMIGLKREFGALSSVSVD